MPLTPGLFSADCMLLRIARRKLTRLRQLLGHALRDQLRVALGVLHLEDVELHLLAGELLQLATDAVGLGTAAADDDARPGGVDVDADAVTGALDLDLGDAGALHALGHELADRDVFLDVLRVLLVGEPAALEVGGDAETEPVRVDLLTHYRVRPFLACSRGLDALDLDGDVAGALADPVGPALRARPEPLERRALVDEGRARRPASPGRARSCARRWRSRWPAPWRPARSRPAARTCSTRQRLLGGHVADQVDHATRLHRRHADVGRPREGGARPRQSRLRHRHLSSRSCRSSAAEPGDQPRRARRSSLM